MPSRKRARTSVVVGRRGARPLDKQVITVNSTFNGTTAVTVTLFGAATRAGTVTGIAWDFTYYQASAFTGAGWWAILHVPHGTTMSNIGTADAGSLYTPERNLLSFGSVAQITTATGIQNPIKIKGQTKTMRKFQAGDTLVLQLRSDTASYAGKFIGGVLFFYKE